MRERYRGPCAPTSDVADHPAARAWAALGLSAGPPSAVTPLKPQVKASHKSGVYRLHGAGPDGRDVVAKRCRRGTAACETEVYGRILPDLPLSQLRLIGHLDEGEEVGFSWMFIEDGGDAACEPPDAPAVARWLATLHVGAARLMDVRPVTLPERGMDYYRRHASQARARLTAAAADPSVPDHELLFDHMRLLDRVERRWEVLTEHATCLPQTLAHGDFVRKNLRARAADGGTDVYVLDWETAGRGSPAADLASLSTMFGDAERAAALAVYAEITRRHWPEADVKAIERTRRAGVILRLLASVEWASHGLGYGYDERALRHLRSYATALRAATVEMRRS